MTCNREETSWTDQLLNQRCERNAGFELSVMAPDPSHRLSNSGTVDFLEFELVWLGGKASIAAKLSLKS